MKKQKTFSILGVLVVLAVAASACGTSASPTAAPTSAPLPTAQAERVFIYADVAPYTDLDPRAGFSDDNRICSNVYEPLVWYNPPGSAEKLSPGLATSWEHNADATEWTFHLRQGVKFHDGTAFNAQAVKTSIDKTRELGLGAAYIWWMVDTIEVVDDSTVTFKLTAPAALDVIASSGYAAWIFSPSVADQTNQWFNEGHDGGTGPYTIESYEPGSRAILTRFDDYWGGWKAGQYDKAIFQTVEDGATRVQMMNAGEADFTWMIPYENLPVLQANKNLVVQANPSFFNVLIKMNSKRPPLDNVLVRQALAYSFPYDACAEQGHSGFVSRSYGPIPPGILGHSDALFQYNYDLDKARQLLAQAGFPNGGFDLSMTTTSDTSRQQCGELWKAELAKLGINVTFDVLTWTAQWELAKSEPSKSFDLGINWWWPTYPSAYDWMYSIYHCEDTVNFNWSRYCNADFDKLVDDAVALEGSDPAAAEKKYIEAQQMLIDQSVEIFVGDLEHVVIFSADIKGFVDNPAYPSVVFVYQLSE